MKGYYNCFEVMVEIIKEGWLCIGDIGIMFEDGFFWIVDCKKDMILVFGFNVFFNEVEDVIVGYFKVMEVVVIGVLYEKFGEVVKVFVVKKEKFLNEGELIEFCCENMIGYKVFKVVEFWKDLLKINVGKILRKELRKEEEVKLV